MKTLLKLLNLLCIYLCCAYAFAGKEAKKVARAFEDFKEKKSKGNEILLTDVDLNDPEAIECFFGSRSDQLLGEETCIKLNRCKGGVKFLSKFLGKQYKTLHLFGNNSMDPGTLGVCLALLKDKCFSELHIELVDYKMQLEERVSLYLTLHENMPLKTLWLTGDCNHTPETFRFILGALVGNTQLTTFGVENKNLDDDCLNELAHLLEDVRRPQIEHLGFGGGNLGRKSLYRFANALPPTLKSFSFGYEKADAEGVMHFVKEVVKNRKLRFIPVGPNYCVLNGAYTRPEEPLAVVPLPSAESREVSVVPEMERSLEPARKKRRVAELDEAMDEGEENPEDKALANIDDAYKNPVMTSKERLFEDEEMPPFHFNGLQGVFPESENDSYEWVPLSFYPWGEF